MEKRISNHPNKIPVITLEALEYDHLSECTPVFNKSTVPYYVYIKVDPAIMRECGLYQVDEVCVEQPRPVFPHAIVRDMNCWLRATMELLNLDPGHHVYKLSFIRRFDNVVFSLYIAYYIQTESPEKPYIYMNRDTCGG